MKSSPDAFALFSEQGDILRLKQEHLIDVASFHKLFLLGRDVFRLNPGDGYLTNDPFAGASFFSQPTMVYRGLYPKQNYYFVRRLGLKNFLPLGYRIEDEGFRIPPTPIITGGKLNQELMGTLAKIPGLPPDLFSKLTDHFLNLKIQSDGMASWQILEEEQLDRPELFMKKFSELPIGKAKTEISWEMGDRVRLVTTLSPDGIIFDFSGTSPSTTWGLTDTATLGVCVNLVHRLLLGELPPSRTSFEKIHVNAPLGSIVNVKQPTSAYRGLREGVYRLTQIIFESINKILHQKQLSHISPAPVWVQIDFSDTDLHFYDAIPSGISASRDSGGEHALDPWSRQPIVNSIEQIECLFPMRILSTQIRKNSGGVGAFQGGSGMTKEIQCLAPFRLRGIIAPHLGNGSPAEIHLKLSDAKGKIHKFRSTNELIEIQEKIWPAGSLITIMSSGGSGYQKS